jgi:hypothetical protein
MAVDSNLPAAWDHTLPYRILIQELAIRRKEVVPSDVNDRLNALDDAESKLKALREQDIPDLAAYEAALDECARCEKPLKAIMHKAELSALCFSGGGIRSASFGLGVLWQLARQSWDSSKANQNGLLNQLDYVSTVSGGGYVGSWFTGWIKRHPKGLNGVIEELATPAPNSVDPEPAPVRHLRDYTSYLAPRSGLLSADRWTLAAIVLRNLLLNWSILVPAFAALLLLPILNTYAFSWIRGHVEAIYLLWTAVGFAFIALVGIAWRLPGNYKIQPKKASFAWVSVPLLLSAWSLAACFLRAQAQNVKFDGQFGRLLIMAGTAHLGFLLIRWAAAIRKKGRERAKRFVRDFFGQLVAAVGSAVFAAWILWLLAVHVGPRLLAAGGDIRLFAGVAVPVIWGAFALTVVLLNGLSARFDAEEDREWWSRSGAYLLMGVVVWPIAHLLVLYAREITAAAESVFGGRVSGTVSIPALTGLIGGLASLAGFSPATASGHSKVDFDKLSRTGKFLSKSNLLLPTLGSLFFVLLAIALGQANDWLCRWIGKSPSPASIPAWAIGVELLCVVTLALVMNVFVNVNTFSLHAMYRGRLVRSYLGASNNQRRPNPFINFDPSDNFLMKDAPASPTDDAAAKEWRAPLHIVNMALNLVASKNLAWQQRKAESFTVSALQSGSFRVGYQPTSNYGGFHGLSLGTAMGISGAAASPNMGYHSNAVLALVMTFFNARLGWWLPNPGLAGGRLKHSGPRFSLAPLLNEALGRTTDKSHWVYLSDGGHFENLGLYEMVLRRCKRIIVVDGGADPGFNLEDLGNAVRKIFIDFGVSIEFDTPPVFEPLPKTSETHCYLAHIRYSRVDGNSQQDDGMLLYIKASLTGDEPADVTQYAKAHPDFPHESTANQFFNESQFESYVRLGSHIVEELAQEGFAGQPPSPMGLDDLFGAAGTKPKAAAAKADGGVV